MRNKKVAYFYDVKLGSYYYGDQHPMKPIRIKMAHQLIVNYGLYRKMNIYEPHLATFNEMTGFHSLDYINYIDSISNKSDTNIVKQYNIGETDCPVFTGMMNFSQMSTGATIDCARLISSMDADIAINWSGGLHHAKKLEASGFCYVNDIVLGILELLKTFNRVLYIDVDVHHGDGVEEAFFLTNRVMTLSYHRYGDFFPGTGSITDLGEGDGKYYAVNVPMKKGIDDDNYLRVFKSITSNVVDYYRPSAIVIQCGADSLSYDKLGDFCLSIKGHGETVEFVKKLNIPMIVLGGGGYTVENVARCWAYETGICLNEELSNDLPITDFYNKYGPDYKLHIKPATYPNQNDRQFLEELTAYTIENLKKLELVPNIEFEKTDESYCNELKSSLLVQKAEKKGEFYDDKYN